jgi:hypothetical protein
VFILNVFWCYYVLRIVPQTGVGISLLKYVDHASGGIRNLMPNALLVLCVAQLASQRRDLDRTIGSNHCKGLSGV